jgi:phage shock protein C
MTGGSPRAVLRRSSSDRVIAGVAGGLAEYLGVDPVLLRIAFVVLALTGSGVLLYVIAWIAIPEAEPAPPTPSRAPAAPGPAGRLVVGGVLIAAGLLVLLDRVIPWFDDLLFPAILVAIGAGIIVYGARR